MIIKSLIIIISIVLIIIGCKKRLNKLNAWDDKNYFDKIGTCPRCGSMHITGNVPRDRGVVTAYICLDCGYTWKRKRK